MLNPKNLKLLLLQTYNQQILSSFDFVAFFLGRKQDLHFNDDLRTMGKPDLSLNPHAPPLPIFSQKKIYQKLIIFYNYIFKLTFK